MQSLKEIENILRPLINGGIGRQLRKATSSNDLTLEVGCGPGQYRYAVNGRYIGLDITAEDYKPDVPRALDVVADGTALPFRLASFDLLFFSNLFTHFEDQPAVLKRATDLVKPGGTILIFDYSPVTLGKLARKYKESGERSQLYPRTANEWIALFEGNGLRNVSIGINAAIWKRLPPQLISKLVGRQYMYQWIDSRAAAIYIYGEKV